MGALGCIPCDASRDSVSGSSECAICREGFFRLRASSSAKECSSCETMRGVRCDTNATVATLNLTKGYWRHSKATREVWPCKRNGGWSPCFGGDDAGVDGVGYCAPGYHGPRCELCDGPTQSMHFDRLEARCHGCGDTTALRFGVPLAVLGVAIICGGVYIATARSTGAISGAIHSLTDRAQMVWQAAGMRFKMKVAIGFYQCMSAVPSVFNVVPPDG